MMTLFSFIAFILYIKVKNAPIFYLSFSHLITKDLIKKKKKKKVLYYIDLILDMFSTGVARVLLTHI
jgi:hypothetical protein